VTADFASYLGIIRNDVMGAMLPYDYEFFRANIFDHLRVLEIQVVSSEEANAGTMIKDPHAVVILPITFSTIISARSEACSDKGALRNEDQLKIAVMEAIGKLTAQLATMKAA